MEVVTAVTLVMFTIIAAFCYSLLLRMQDELSKMRGEIELSSRQQVVLLETIARLLRDVPVATEGIAPGMYMPNIDERTGLGTLIPAGGSQRLM